MGARLTLTAGFVAMADVDRCHVLDHCKQLSCVACSTQKASNEIHNLDFAHRRSTKMLDSLLAGGFRAIACSLSGQMLQWQTLRLILSCKITTGKAIFSLKIAPVTQLFEERSQVTCLHAQR